MRMYCEEQFPSMEIIIWKMILLLLLLLWEGVPLNGNCYFLAGDDQQLNNSQFIKLPLPARAEYALRSGHICASLWSMWISHLCKYATMWSMWISSGHNLCIKLTQGLLCPPLHWLTLTLRSKSMLYLKDRIVKTCKRKTKSHQSSSCEFKLVAIETNWLTKLLRHVVSCHRRALSVINSDYLIQRIFPHCHNIGSDSNIFGSLFCMWVQKVLTIETNWATKCRVIKAHYQWLTLTND